MSSWFKPLSAHRFWAIITEGFIFKTNISNVSSVTLGLFLFTSRLQYFHSFQIQERSDPRLTSPSSILPTSSRCYLLNTETEGKIDCLSLNKACCTFSIFFFWRVNWFQLRLWYLWRCAPSLRSALVRGEVETIYYDLVHGEQRVVGVLRAFYLRTAVFFSLLQRVFFSLLFPFYLSKHYTTMATSRPVPPGPEDSSKHCVLTGFCCCSTKTEEIGRRRRSSTLGCPEGTRGGGKSW